MRWFVWIAKKYFFKIDSGTDLTEMYLATVVDRIMISKNIVGGIHHRVFTAV